jgi:hypothetical protein
MYHVIDLSYVSSSDFPMQPFFRRGLPSIFRGSLVVSFGTKYLIIFVMLRVFKGILTIQVLIHGSLEVTITYAIKDSVRHKDVFSSNVLVSSEYVKLCLTAWKPHFHSVVLSLKKRGKK